MLRRKGGRSTSSMTKAEDIRKRAGETKRRNIPFYLDEGAVLGLIRRVAGEEYASRFRIRQRASESGMDEYDLYCEGGHVCIDATSGVAAAAAGNNYLGENCGYYAGFITTGGTLPPKPPLFAGRKSERSVFHYRYLFNFCTFAYTYAFSGWEDWEGILDRALLSGYNLVLNPVGCESVWKKLLEGLGYTGKQIREFLVNPAFLPFLWMGNMSDYGGEYPEWWFDARAELGRKITNRLREFGAAAMLPGYCGMVPDDFRSHFPQSAPFDQGLWNGLRRPAYLLPGDPMFDAVADAYYEIQRQTVGEAHYWSVDPFHEGGISEGIDLKAFARSVMAKMKEHDAGAVWFLQGWQANPRRELLAGLHADEVLVGDLLADEKGGGGDNFGNTPWLYCNVVNFGGQHVMRGNVRRALFAPFARAADENSTMVGVGFMPEGVEDGEIFFDIFASLSVREKPPALEDYLRGFIRRRYGVQSAAAEAAWKILAEKVYLADSSVYPMESAFCARPSVDVDRVSTWGRGCEEGTAERMELVRATRLLFADYELLKGSPSYRFDLVDLARQCNAALGWDAVYAFLRAFRAGDKEGFLRGTRRFFRLFSLQEEIVASDGHFLLSKWLERAKAQGRDEPEKRWFEFYARVQITTWSDSRTGWFHEYAAKEWQGMLSDFYRPRWEAFVSMLELSLYAGKPLPAYRDYDREIMFAYGRKDYPLRPQGDPGKTVGRFLAFCEREKLG